MIERERTNIALYLEDSPTLRTYLSQEWINKMYRTARLDAAQETQLAMPQTCSYTIEDVLQRVIEEADLWLSKS